MSIDLPLNSMTTGEKLQLMESIWDSLRTEPQSLPAPDWHRDVLEERTRQIAAGEVEFSTWEDAKERLNKLGNDED